MFAFEKNNEKQNNLTKNKNKTEGLVRTPYNSISVYMHTKQMFISTKIGIKNKIVENMIDKRENVVNFAVYSFQ